MTETLQTAQTALAKKRAEKAEAQARADRATTADELIKAEAEAKIADRALPALEQAVKDAEAAYAAEQREKVAQHISTTLPPYDADIWRKIDTAKDALQALAAASDARETAVKACRNLIEEVGTDPPLLQLGAVPLANNYRLTSTRSEVATELAAIVGPVWRSLNEEALARDAGLRVYGGNRLRRTNEREAA